MRPSPAGTSSIPVAIAVVAVLVACADPIGAPSPSGRPYRAIEGSHPVIVAAGDIACPPSVAPCEPERDTASLVERIDPAAVLVLGDSQYTSGTLDEFMSSYDRTWGAFVDRTHAVPGNHEHRTASAAGFFGYFGSGALSVRGADSFDVGRWHILAVDSAAPGGIDEEQLAWVRSDLPRSDARCELAYWHHPRWSSGAVEGDDPMPELQPLWTAMDDAGVDVVLNGHAHNYERFAPLDALGRVDPMGVREFVVGTGGAAPHPFRDEPAEGSRVRITGVHGVLEIVLRPRGYDWRFVGVDAVVLDHGAGRCQQ